MGHAWLLSETSAYNRDTGNILDCAYNTVASQIFQNVSQLVGLIYGECDMDFRSGDKVYWYPLSLKHLKHICQKTMSLKHTGGMNQNDNQIFLAGNTTNIFAYLDLTFDQGSRMLRMHCVEDSHRNILFNGWSDRVWMKYFSPEISKF